MHTTPAGPSPLATSAPLAAGHPVRRNRHIPRLCGSCHAAMSGQDDACWSCGATWTDADALTAVPGGVV